MNTAIVVAMFTTDVIVLILYNHKLLVVGMNHLSLGHLNNSWIILTNPANCSLQKWLRIYDLHFSLSAEFSASEILDRL